MAVICLRPRQKWHCYLPCLSYHLPPSGDLLKLWTRNTTILLLCYMTLHCKINVENFYHYSLIEEFFIASFYNKIFLLTLFVSILCENNVKTQRECVYAKITSLPFEKVYVHPHIRTIFLLWRIFVSFHNSYSNVK